MLPPRQEKKSPSAIRLIAVCNKDDLYIYCICSQSSPMLVVINLTSKRCNQRNDGGKQSFKLSSLTRLMSWVRPSFGMDSPALL
ncbi:hypothetical protein HNY73_017998 [Argiope bruennichi]|uniref:Uncharacterized protein n=1 Tax=Argiope bruennichi TaxID=94029 RepID=A0A8T0ECW5_ARGBR|nr:hypothetical protein HNY73_017998 [Argiope bruennichi]